MTFWTVFGAVVLAQISIASVYVAGAWIVHRLKRRRIEREVRHAIASMPAPHVGSLPGLGVETPVPSRGDRPPNRHGTLACPFCGHNEHAITRYDQYPGGPERVEFAVTCYTCGAYGPAEGQPEEAEDAWNRPPRGPETVLL